MGLGGNPGPPGRRPHAGCRLSSQRNVIHTAKYNVFSFLPLNLYEQFHRMSSLYFLIIILQVGRVGQPEGSVPCPLHSFYLLEPPPPGSPPFPLSHVAL